MENNFKQLCVWPGTVCGAAKAEEFENFIEQEFNGVRIKYECEVLTLPDKDKNGDDIPETGGRNDLFFFVHDEDVNKFAVPRIQIGIRWWEDVIKYNDNSHLYTKEFIEKYPITW